MSTYPTSSRTFRSTLWLTLVASLQVFACSGDTDGKNSPTGDGIGGNSPNVGGNVAATSTASTVLGLGGAATGGSGQTEPGTLPGSGGGLHTGGATNGSSNGTGGVASSSGGTSSGGSSSGGTSSTGGKAATGGKSSTGGTTTTGGKSSTGGTATAGGKSSTGGTTTAGGKSSVGGSTGALPAVTIYIAGDSTVCDYKDTAATNDQAGWGQMLKGIFNTKVTIVNRAAGGRTAYWFYLEGGVSSILSTIKAGDYFFIQFGTNDQNATATFTVNGTTYPRYAAADTTFKTQLKTYYLDPIRAKGAIPVLVTPPPRNSAYCNGGNGLGAYATAMVQLGAAENVAVVENNLKTFNYLKAICPKPTTAATETFFLGKADGTIDGTHFQENGARKMAGFIGTGIKEIGLGLAGYLL